MTRLSSASSPLRDGSAGWRPHACNPARTSHQPTTPSPGWGSGWSPTLQPVGRRPSPSSPKAPGGWSSTTRPATSQPSPRQHRPGHPALVGHAQEGGPGDQPDPPGGDRRRLQRLLRRPPLQQGRWPDHERALWGEAAEGQRPRVLPRAIHCFKMPSLAKSSLTRVAFLLSASAIFVTPVDRRNPIAAFRNAAITSGPDPFRIRLASSPRVTSRT
jgi:hypothetical protein